MEGMCVPSLRECTAVIQKFKLTKISALQFNTSYFPYRMRKDCVTIQNSECTPRQSVYYILAGGFVCDVIHSFSFSAGGPGPVPALVADLFAFVGWQEHEISSGCTVAGRPANSMALQVSCCSCYRLPCPLLPFCRPLVLRATPCKQTCTHTETDKGSLKS